MGPILKASIAPNTVAHRHPLSSYSSHKFSFASNLFCSTTTLGIYALRGHLWTKLIHAFGMLTVSSRSAHGQLTVHY
jgi:hypothetical protein